MCDIMPLTCHRCHWVHLALESESFEFMESLDAMGAMGGMGAVGVAGSMPVWKLMGNLDGSPTLLLRVVDAISLSTRGSKSGDHWVVRRRNEANFSMAMCENVAIAS